MSDNLKGTIEERKDRRGRGVRAAEKKDRGFPLIPNCWKKISGKKGSCHPIL